MTSEEELTIQLLDVEEWQPPQGQPGEGRLLRTTRGNIAAILHAPASTAKVVVWVWGARGGLDG